MHSPDLFCPTCRRYLGPAPECACGYERPAPLPAPGAPLWRCVPGGPLRGAPALDEGGLYVAGKEGVLCALTRDGALRWTSQPIGAPIRQTPVIAAGRVIVGTESGEIVACRTDDGTVAWRAPTGAPATGGLAVARGTVYVGDAYGRLHALDAAHGRPAWPYPFQARKRIAAAPVVRREMVIVGDCADALYFVDAHRGRELWPPVDLEDRITASVAAAGAHVFAGTREGRLVKLAAASGRLDPTWTFEAAGPILSGLVISPDRRRLYAGAGDGLYAIDTETAACHWCFDGGGTVAAAPVLWEGLCFVGTNSGLVVALDAETGAVLWRYELGERVTGLAFDAGVLYGVGADGAVCALPWHLGRWAEAAAYAERRGDLPAAATLHALAGDEILQPDGRRKHYEAAIGRWRASPDPERAARLMEAAPYLYTADEVAEAYQHTAHGVAPRDRTRAAVLLQRAARWFDEAGRPDAAEACRVQASRLAMLPRLRVELINRPSLEAGEPGQIVFDVRNFGDAPTHGTVSVRLGGQLAKGWTFDVPPIAAGAKQEIIANDVVFLGPDFRIDLGYGAAADLRLEHTQHFTLDITPLDADILVGGDAGPVILRLEEGAPMPKVRVRGSAAMIKVQPATKLPDL